VRGLSRQLAYFARRFGLVIVPRRPVPGVPPTPRLASLTTSMKDASVRV
jgi:hypothetical protein